MDNSKKQIIFAVLDKTGDYPKYTGFFSSRECAIMELKSQMSYAHSELGLTNLELIEERCIGEWKSGLLKEAFLLKEITLR